MVPPRRHLSSWQYTVNHIIAGFEVLKVSNMRPCCLRFRLCSPNPSTDFCQGTPWCSPDSHRLAWRFGRPSAWEKSPSWARVWPATARNRMESVDVSVANCWIGSWKTKKNCKNDYAICFQVKTSAVPRYTRFQILPHSLRLQDWTQKNDHSDATFVPAIYLPAW